MLIPCANESRGQGAIISVCLWSLKINGQSCSDRTVRVTGRCSVISLHEDKPESSGSTNGAGKPSGKKSWRLKVDEGGIMNLGYNGEKDGLRGNAA